MRLNAWLAKNPHFYLTDGVKNTIVLCNTLWLAVFFCTNLKGALLYYAYREIDIENGKARNLKPQIMTNPSAAD